MIKVCPFEDKWHDSINFVDDNNRFVGYEYSSQCCEQFGYLFCRFNSQEDADRFDNNGDNCFDIDEMYFKDTVIVDNPDLSNAFFSNSRLWNMESSELRVATNAIGSFCTTITTDIIATDLSTRTATKSCAMRRCR